MEKQINTPNQSLLDEEKLKFTFRWRLGEFRRKTGEFGVPPLALIRKIKRVNLHATSGFKEGEI